MCYEVMNLNERTNRYETRERGDVVRLLYTGPVLYLVLILQPKFIKVYNCGACNNLPMVNINLPLQSCHGLL
jgi:hypothetical protein